MNGRHVLSTCLLCVATLATSGPVCGAEASPHPPLRMADISTLLFEDLLPKFEKLSTGTSVAEAIAAMGKPNEVSTQEVLGISYQTLTWRSTWPSQTFVARFVMGRLASKSLST